MVSDPRASRPGAAPLDLHVARKERAADGVVALTLRRADGGRLPDWSPGAHVDLVLPNGTTRQYSLCGDRWDAHAYRIAVLREPAGRGGSAFVHDDLAEGDRVGLGGPRNGFRLVPAGRYAFIAGGIGITPLLPMIDQAERQGVPWTLRYGGRTRSSMAFLDELAAYGAKATIVPHDEHGPLDLAAALTGLPGDARIYCCGPAGLLDAVAARCADLPPGRLRLERFVAAARADGTVDDAFQVELRRSGRTLTVAPSETLLDALGAAGVSVLSSCGQGLCGTCETTVLDGVPDHRDALLDDADRAAGDCMLVCVSRAASARLVLDL
ncbi:ferredoxin-NADP reductase [Actinocorallia herbida]|uniref:Ferredoxin-NADP reductase n=1 Tax=Actinocorallia herbida TaxID=58109 RepID=A0A3N1CXM3_9ACTN|nr:PDR/VanB family oxidoreductase [Actinocorallia herbida]ROO86043.1 ferredoxin-NADP reductase [Actinocorallia herbida]